MHVHGHDSKMLPKMKIKMIGGGFRVNWFESETTDVWPKSSHGKKLRETVKKNENRNTASTFEKKEKQRH